MISARISRASAVFLLIGGVALLFASDEILPRLVAGFPLGGSWIGQLIGAGWLAVAALNWLSRSTLLGGIYGRPLLLANLSLYFISAMVLMRAATGGPPSAALWLVTVAVALFAGVYAVLLFRGPAQRDFEAHRAPSSAALPVLLVCALAFGGITSCRDVAGPLPDGTEPFQPPAVFSQWWSLTQACSGRTGSMSNIDWYIVRGGDGTSYFQPAGNRIVLAEDSWLDGDVVRHEMLHALLGINGPGHPRDQFLGRCRGVVSCTTSCRAEAGPPAPIAVAQTITPEGLELSAEVTPQFSGIPPYGQYFSVIVAVRNPANQAVNLQLPAQGGGMTFQIRLISFFGRVVSYNVHPSDPADTVFTAGETKRYIFDMAVGDPPLPYIIHSTPDRIIPPGRYRVEFGYADRRGVLPDELLVTD